MIYEWNQFYETLSVQKCIQGLTIYAANAATNGQEDRITWLRAFIEDMAGFWGLEAPDRYLDAFEQAVSESRSLGRAAVLSDQRKLDILQGLQQYIDEMRVNDEEQKPWFIECVSFMQELIDQWQLVPGQSVKKPDCALIGEDGNIFILSGIAAQTLREMGFHQQAEELQKRIFDGEGGDYFSALRIISEYVDITGPNEYGMEMGGM